MQIFFLLFLQCFVLVLHLGIPCWNWRLLELEEIYHHFKHCAEL